MIKKAQGIRECSFLFPECDHADRFATVKVGCSYPVSSRHGINPHGYISRRDKFRAERELAFGGCHDFFLCPPEGAVGVTVE